MWWRRDEFRSGGRLDEDECAEDGGWRRVEARHAHGRRRNERLLGAPGATALALGRHGQIAVDKVLRRVGRANHHQVQHEASERDGCHDAFVPEREAD